jgi:hypothetical protein
MFYRAFVEKGDIAAAVRGVKARAAIFPLSQAAKPPATSFVNISGREFNTISANVALRLYGPLEPWFDKTWRPGDIELQP